MKSQNNEPKKKIKFKPVEFLLHLDVRNVIKLPDFPPKERISKKA